MTEWALLAFQACQFLGLRFNSSHLQEQGLKEESLGIQKTEATPEMLKIGAFIPRKVDVIKAGSEEKSPFDESQMSNRGILKLNVSLWIHLQRTCTCHSLTGW